jgi:two-component system cell cycle sensor histidine kinase/response regulator CckA
LKELIMLKEEPVAGSHTLLLVDDEEMLVELLRRMLHRRGYETIVAYGAKEGLAAYEENKDKIDLVITDLVMPGTDGRALAEELMRRDANLPILVSTGFSAEGDIDALRMQGIKGVVMKPYQSEQLFSMLKDALGE